MTFPFVSLGASTRARAWSSACSSASASASCWSAPASAARTKLAGAVLRQRHDRVQGHVRRHRHRHAGHRGRLRAWASWTSGASPTPPPARRSSGRMIVGGFALGVGFIVSGYCPGTSMWPWPRASSTGSWRSLGVIVGQVVWTELEHGPLLDRSTTRATSGTSTSTTCWPAGARRPGRRRGRRGRHGRRRLPGRREASSGSWRRRRRPARPARPRRGRPAPPGLRRLRRLRGVVGLAGARRPHRNAAACEKPVDPSPRRARAARPRRSPGRSASSTSRPWPSARRRASPARSARPPETSASSGSPTPNAARPGARGGGPSSTRCLPPRPRRTPGAWPCSPAASRPGRRYALTPPAPPAAGAPAADLEAYRLRAGIAAAMTGVKAAPPPPPPSAAPAGGARKKKAAAAAAASAPRRTRT